MPDLRIIDPELWESAQHRLHASRQSIVDTESDSMGSDSQALQPEPSRGARLSAARRPVWLLSGLVRCGLCRGPVTVMSGAGRLGCANHRERGTWENGHTLLRTALTGRVLDGLKQRLLAPALVEEFVTAYLAEIEAANRDRVQRQSRLRQEQARLARAVRNLVELAKEGGATRATVDELRMLERKQDAVAAELAAAEVSEPLPALHPNLPQVYRRTVEQLETALVDPATEVAGAGFEPAAFRL